MVVFPSLKQHHFQAKIEKLLSSIRTMGHVKIGGVGSCQTGHIKNDIHLSLSLGESTTLVSLDLLAQSQQLTTLLFIIVLSHGLVGVAWP